jgi:negative regulator of sigma E activity
MCPDRELLSAYVDGEVPSPWRERIAEHLASCPDCAAVAEGYSALGEAIRSEAPSGEAEALARVRARLEARLAGADAGPSAAASRPALWTRSVRLPLPVAAAAALVVLAAGGAATTLALGQRRGSPAFAAVAAPGAIATSAISSPAAQPTSMDELLRYLDAHDAQVTITMNLPTGTRFDDSGEPVIIRASQEAPGAAYLVPSSSGGGAP